MKQWIIDRLKEPSTYKGLAVIIGAAGAVVPVGADVALYGLAMSLFGFVEIVRKER